MRNVRYLAEFFGPEPERLSVGDTVEVSGRATVHAIHGDLIDVTRIGADPEFVLGEMTVELVVTSSRVSRA